MSAAVTGRHSAAAIIVPPRSAAVPRETAKTALTQQDHHLRLMAVHGRVAWQQVFGNTIRARAEAVIGRFKQVSGDGLRPHTDAHRATEVGVAVHTLNRMLDLGRPNSVCAA